MDSAGTHFCLIIIQIYVIYNCITFLRLNLENCSQVPAYIIRTSTGFLTVIRQENSDNFIITKPHAIRISIQRFMIVDHMFLSTIFLINAGNRIRAWNVYH